MSNRAIVWVKVLVHALCLAPLVWLAVQYKNGALAAQADPVNYLTHFTGDWALWLLLVSLTITPLRRAITKLAWVIRLRRMTGLYAFFYATLHLAVYVLLFSGYDFASAQAGVAAGHYGEPFHQLGLIWPAMLDDLQKRRFIQVGLAAWVVLLALAVTSPQWVLRTMGGKNWQRLHYCVYAAAIAAVVHYWWLVKAGVTRPLPDTLVLAVLLGIRVVLSVMKRMKAQPKAAVA